MYRPQPDSRPVWSDFLQRDVLVTPMQFRMLCRLAQTRRSWRQRELAEAAGYSGPGSVSRALRHLARLGLIAVSTTRGCHGSTTAWIRRGVNALRAGRSRNVAATIKDGDRHRVNTGGSASNIRVGALLEALLETNEAARRESDGLIWQQQRAAVVPPAL